MILNKLINIRKEIYDGFNPWLLFKSNDYKYKYRFKELFSLPFLVDCSTNQPSIMDERYIDLNINEYKYIYYNNLNKEHSFLFRIIENNKKETFLITAYGYPYCYVMKVIADDFKKFIIEI